MHTVEVEHGWRTSIARVERVGLIGRVQFESGHALTQAIQDRSDWQLCAPLEVLVLVLVTISRCLSN